MTPLQERIAQFRNMTAEDPENELGHFRLGQLLMEAEQFEEAAASFARTLQIAPHFSKVYQLLGQCRLKQGRRDDAVRILKDGWEVADIRGDKMPRDEMGRILVELGETPPAAQQPAGSDLPGDGFVCQRPGCPSANRARGLATPPLADAIGQRIMEAICADCWDYWYKNYSIKVINELRLDLSTEFGQAEYDKHMREYMGFAESETAPTG